MMQIWFLSNGSYSLKNCHNPFGKAIQPPPLTAKFRLNTENPYVGLPLEQASSKAICKQESILRCYFVFIFIKSFL